ncbi:hypothetical protein FZC79_07825 [Rossellomorea vietnamensis]|uniref:Homing endonuclease LAGLIDADG domain-containing protein n=1 Tax=Rossellomorea vietnamensis TaxID=218284 RepID=A0A5D4KIH0_9BACI|nr:hypothetical protein [Rossellomorea vietnamensis]TYR76053.1 hypothetical protein FZC79_07825 [Rossellomorea vietnamensis]
MLTGKLLGDGYLIKQPGRKPRLQFIHCAKDREWCDHCFREIDMYIPLTGPHYKKVNDKRIADGYTEGYYVQSKTHPIITSLEAIWYKDRKKRLPFDHIHDYLTPLSLAWWYQDGCHLKKKGNTVQKIIFSTESFTPHANLLHCKMLKDKFCLQFSTDKQNRIIFYDQFQIHYFLHLVSSYMHPFKEGKLKAHARCLFQLNPKGQLSIYLKRFL